MSTTLKIKTIALTLFVTGGMAAQADITIGGRPSAGMGGAGLALPMNSGQQGIINPSLLGFAPSSLVFNWPSIGYRLEGVSISDLKNTLGNIDKGGLDQNKIAAFATSFGDSTKSFGLTADASITYGGFALTGSAEANVTTIPNQALQTWVNGGSVIASLTGGEQLDAYGIGYAQVGVGYGRLVKSKLGQLAVGATLKEVKGYYSHKIESSAAIKSQGVPVNGTEFPDTAVDTLQKDGVGLDAGVTFSPKQLKMLYAGLVVENLIQPKVNFDYENPNNGPVAPGAINLFGTTYDVGLGAVLTKKIVAAADVIDVTNRASRQELRLGVSANLFSIVTFSGGYSSRTRGSLGVSAFGIDLVYSQTSPITVGSAFKF